MPEYYVLTLAPHPNYCVISDLPSDMPHSHYAVDGISLGQGGYDYVFDMAADEPGLLVADLVDNTLGYTLASAALKDFLETNSGAEIEFTPFRLRNHKRRFVDEELFIANVIGTIDWVDREQTEGDEDPVNPGRYMAISKLVFDPDRIDPDVDLFRLAVFPEYLVFREDLKTKLEQSGMTGFAFHRVGDDVELW